MIVDTSALLAIIYGEPEAESFARLILAESTPAMAAVTYLEAALKLDGDLKKPLGPRLDDTIAMLGLGTLSFTAEHARLARQAAKQFGKGNHPAKLNFGDCIVYATAQLANRPLLFKGNDFSQTDLVPAISKDNP
ncbi:type II toxin-antitoxin system VapC family toxin [Sandaracinobacteroides saxicola]|uniref:Ribonuclease VapC n=1 Tax=Sandaracinobacteroides saxicola TaxID=2759707 RepID=A0A7G5IHC5_9SPHN|nr:type II toxin-antitoxin system VapC family toxin [Sandaracinobacteroides saxicola]QMW22767.1 type II toxin-antitoxin system VapC family toxin [Sandaracinobacteroides saxicola]